ncbi:MAG TPA: 2,3,4,5-tetrahydropyridine-2,6-dicarboxylate N-succinyltransferase [Caulobacteraceae bacterium]|nr:2,3,4,5-tetrahydropyridine-2,6-dicarboxylate N-succinyltransferase [Caulobacteraceae bacterium]
MNDIAHRLQELESAVEATWEERDGLGPTTVGFRRETVEESIALMDSGQARVAEKRDGEWVVRQWLKKAVLMSFRLHGSVLMANSSALTNEPGMGPWWDKVPTKFANWAAADFTRAGFRAVPGCIVRRGAYVAPDVVLMPSFVNIGAYVGEGTMVDTWATVGSCAQIGKHVHLSGGAGIGGVLEPLQANPTIIEDGCFIGARSEVAEGVIVGEGSVLAPGVFLTGSVKIVDRQSGEVIRGRVPPYSVVVPGVMPGAEGGPSLACAVIVKTVDAQTRAKTSVNELLRS